MIWSTTRCTRCLDVIEPGRVHLCSRRPGSGVTHDIADSVPVAYNDPATLRAMAERWDDERVGVPGLVVDGVYDVRPHVHYVLALVADAMEEAE